MKKQHQLALAIALAISTGSLPLAAAQSAADFQDAEYYASSGLDLINAAAAYAAGYTGKGVTIGICDHPINFLNPEFNQKKASFMVNQAKMYRGEPGVYDWNLLYHGTHVAGVAAADRNGQGMQGVAYEAEVAGSTAASEYAANGAWGKYNRFYEYYMAHPEIKVINNSWGAAYNLDSLYTDGLTAAHRLELLQDLESGVDWQEILNAAGQNKLLVFSAGNGGHTNAGYPPIIASFEADVSRNILSVTALDKSNVRNDGKIVANQLNSNLMAFFSDLAKYSEDRTIAAPGYAILSANANFAADRYRDVFMDGTSVAAPFVTGAGAVVQQAFSYLSARQIGDVLLSTANSNIYYPRGMVTQIQRNTTADGQTTFQLNIFVVDSKLKGWSKDALLQKYQEYIASHTLDSLQGHLLNWLDNWKTDGGITNVYYDVPLQELIGQGVLDAGAAVKGPGTLNARRLDPSDISSSYTLSGTQAKQALYTVDTQGYDSVWSNDIKEIRAGYIAADSTEADLQERYDYYNTNWLSYTGTDDRTAAIITTGTMMDLYNQQVRDSGLAGLSVGLYKAGAGTLTLTGQNTYKGSSIAAGGTLAIDGLVAGDAWSIQDSSAGTTGLLTGSGVIGGNFYNHGIVQPSAAGDLTVHGSLVSDGSLGLITADQGQSARQLSPARSSCL